MVADRSLRDQIKAIDGFGDRFNLLRGSQEYEV